MLDLALIPARGGSKGLPGKNIRALDGVPLIAWTIAAARNANLFKRIVVSTDDASIANAAIEYGAEVPFLRPASLAADHSTSNDVIAHALEALEIGGKFALLQPTSPFRTADHIQEANDLWISSKARMVLSVTAAKPMVWLLTMGEDGNLQPAAKAEQNITRRQDGEACVIPNGAIYLCDHTTFREFGGLPVDHKTGYCMSAINSLDIDSAEDFDVASALVANRTRIYQP